VQRAGSATPLATPDGCVATTMSHAIDVLADRRMFVIDGAAWGDGRMVGYYALAPPSVQHGDVTGKVRRNMPNPVPAILLSRLALDRKEEVSGLGKHLLRCHPALSRGIRNHRRPGAARACAQRHRPRLLHPLRLRDVTDRSAAPATAD